MVKCRVLLVPQLLVVKLNTPCGYLCERYQKNR